MIILSIKYSEYSNIQDIGNIPKSKSSIEIDEEFRKLSGKNTKQCPSAAIQTCK